MCQVTGSLIRNPSKWPYLGWPRLTKHSSNAECIRPFECFSPLRIHQRICHEYYAVLSTVHTNEYPQTLKSYWTHHDTSNWRSLPVKPPDDQFTLSGRRTLIEVGAKGKMLQTLDFFSSKNIKISATFWMGAIFISVFFLTVMSNLIVSLFVVFLFPCLLSGAVQVGLAYVGVGLGAVLRGENHSQMAFRGDKVWGKVHPRRLDSSLTGRILNTNFAMFVPCPSDLI